MSAATGAKANKASLGRKELKRAGSDMMTTLRGKEVKDRTVAKALNSKRQLAPKTKHVRNLVLRVWRENSIRSFYRDVARLSVESDACMSFKALIVLHKLLHDGPPNALADAHAQIAFLSAMESNWDRRYNDEYSALILEYSKFLRQKINFHQTHQEFDGKFSLQEYLNRLQKNSGLRISTRKGIKIVQGLLGLQEAMLAVGQEVFKFPATRITEAKVSVFIPVVQESWCVYELIVYLLQLLCKAASPNKMVPYLVKHFEEQYPNLRNYYDDISNIQYVASVIRVPTLGPNCPTFGVSGSDLIISSSDDENDVRHAPYEVPEPEPFPLVQQQPTPQQMPPPQQDTRQRFWSQPPPVQSQTSFLMQPPQQPPPPQFLPSGNFFQQPQEWVKFDSSPSFSMGSFSTLPGSSSATMGGVEQTQTLPFEKVTVETEKQDEKPAEPEKQPEPQPTLPYEQLKKKFLALQLLFKQERAKNQKLVAYIKQQQEQQKQQQAKWQATRESMMKRLAALEKEKSSMEDESDELKEQLIKAEKALTAQERIHTVHQLDAARADLERSIASLLGQATGISQKPEDLFGHTSALEGLVERVLAADSPEARADAIRFLSEATQTMLQQVTAIADKIEDPVAREQLMAASQRAASMIAKLIAVLQASPDDADAIAQQAALALEGIKSVSVATQALLDLLASNDAAKEDAFADQATKELMNAVRVIEQAAATLAKTKAMEKPKLSEVESAICNAIIDAAMAIASATSALVKQATIVQKENVAKGRALGEVSESWYRKNAKWSQGLISAAKAVAEGTSMLVYAANETALGHIQEEALIASSMSVSASTAQLIAASRVRSDPNSKAQLKLEDAAKAVSSSTQKLVEAAKSARPAIEEQPELPQFRSTVMKMKAQQEAQMRVLELEKLLENARGTLFRINESEYRQQSSAASSSNK